MEIPFIYILISAEILLILFALSSTLIFLLIRKQKSPPVSSSQQTEDETEVINYNNSYINYLEKEIERNTIKLKQQKNNEEDKSTEEENSEKSNSDTDDKDDTENTSPAPDEKQSELLQARESFLLIEKEAAEKTEHEINFWDSIYDGIKKLLEKYRNIEEITTTETLTTSADEPTHITESKEKVFYIETQGKKIDGEVNKLKDIIYEQENALSSMKKSLENSEEEDSEDSELFTTLKESIEIIEHQLNDSKMCMEVLEMENERLQEEIDKMDARHNSLFENNTLSTENDNLFDLDQMKEVIEQQELKIEQLIESIESLEIDSTQAEKLKKTIGDFSRTSKEMMSCITILEEENERLQAAATAQPETETENETAKNDEDINSIKQQISSLEEELIKKDVAYAKLQDEFNSMETEYLAMYEAMHGDNS